MQTLIPSSPSQGEKLCFPSCCTDLYWQNLLLQPFVRSGYALCWNGSRGEKREGGNFVGNKQESQRNQDHKPPSTAISSWYCTGFIAHTLPPHSPISYLIQCKASLPHPLRCTFFPLRKHLSRCPSDEVLSQPGCIRSNTIMQKLLAVRAAGHEELQIAHQIPFHRHAVPSPGTRGALISTIPSSS